MGTLLRELNLSAVYVTHDQAEAFTIANRVAVMLGGEIAQIADAGGVVFGSGDARGPHSFSISAR